VSVKNQTELSKSEREKDCNRLRLGNECVEEASDGRERKSSKQNKETQNKKTRNKQQALEGKKNTGDYQQSEDWSVGRTCGKKGSQCYRNEKARSEVR
jgi:hypothetical protein